MSTSSILTSLHVIALCVLCTAHREARAGDEIAAVAEVARVESTKSSEVNTEITADRAEKKIRAAFDRLRFDWGSSVVRFEDHSYLDDVVTVLDEYQNLILELQGCTDKTGPAGFNASLAKKRAKNVRAYLVRRGVRAERLVVVAGAAQRKQFKEKLSEARRIEPSVRY